MNFIAGKDRDLIRYTYNKNERIKYTKRHSMFIDRKTQFLSCQDSSSSQTDSQSQCNANENPIELHCGYLSTDSEVYMER